MALTTTLRAKIAVVGSPASTRIDVAEALEMIADILDSEQSFIGDTRFLFTNTAPTNWLKLEGGTIGNGSSSATLRANADTQSLFVWLWGNLADAQAAVSGGRGGSALADFNANKRIAVPDLRGRSPLGKSTSGVGSILGGTYGTLEHSHTVPAHFHGMGTGADLNIVNSGTHTTTASSGNNSVGHSHGQTNKNSNTEAAGLGLVSAGTGLAFVNRVQISEVAVAGSLSTSGETVPHTHTITVTGNGAHTHASGNFAGRIGLVTGGVDGNASMTSGTATHAVMVGCWFIKYS